MLEHLVMVAVAELVTKVSTAQGRLVAVAVTD
jgi:hypothetical protein